MTGNSAKRAPQTKRRPKAPSFRAGPGASSLDLGFLEFHVLARDRIVFLEHELLRLGAGVLLGHVEIAGVGRRKQLDLERGGLGHGLPSDWAAPRRRRKTNSAGGSPPAPAAPDIVGDARKSSKSSTSECRSTAGADGSVEPSGAVAGAKPLIRGARVGRNA